VSELVLRFTARVACRREASAPLGLTMIGRVAPDEVAYLSLACTAPADLPAWLDDCAVQKVDAEHYRISAGERTWLLAASRCLVHRDVGAAFYRAIPPRPAPWPKRLMWRVLLGALATPLGRWWLARRAHHSQS
jgi:hypothetical protein